MTVEKPESVSCVSEQEHIAETKKTTRPVDEKVATAATSIRVRGHAVKTRVS